MKILHITNLAVVVAVILGLSGCNTLQKSKDGEQRDWLGRKVEIEYKVPSKVVAIWSNSVFNKSGEAPQRGLGGRIYFYDDEHHPVRVDGSLTVYCYDDTDAKPNDKLKQEANRVYHFEGDEVKSKFSPTEFGSSYSFWLPWDAVGGERKQLSIIPVYTDSTGHMVVGEQARQLLPGKEPVEFTDENGNPVVQASFTTHTKEHVKVTKNVGTEDKRVAKSSRIHLPPSMQHRLRQPPMKKKSWNIYEMAKLENPIPSPRSALANPKGEFKVTEPVTQAADEGNDQTSTSSADAAGIENAQQIANKLGMSNDQLQALMERSFVAKQSVRNGIPAKQPRVKPVLGKFTKSGSNDTAALTPSTFLKRKALFSK